MGAFDNVEHEGGGGNFYPEEKPVETISIPFHRVQVTATQLLKEDSLSKLWEIELFPLESGYV